MSSVLYYLAIASATLAIKIESTLLEFVIMAIRAGSNPKENEG